MISLKHILIACIICTLFSSSDNNKLPEFNYDDAILSKTINPHDYIVGPGDSFSFSLISTNQIIKEILIVSPTGDVLIPLVGKINVDKMSLVQAFTIIKKNCIDYYPDSDVNIMLNSMKQFRVLVSSPISSLSGYRKVNSTTTLIDLFDEIQIDFASDSIPDLEISSRNLTIISKKSDGSSVVRNFDLEKFKRISALDQNPSLNPEDIVKLGFIESHINIGGAVVLPGKYEYREGDSLADIINFAGGLLENIHNVKNNVEVLRHINSSENEIISLTIINEQIPNFKIMPHDQVLIKLKSDYKRIKTVSIKGEILNPGTYTINDSTTIKDVIIRAGGYTKESDVAKIIINNEVIDKIGDKELLRISAINPSDRSDTDLSYIRARARSERGEFRNSEFNLIESVISSYKLFDKDVIIIPKKYDFIEVIGAVRNPGRYPYLSTLSINDYVIQSGGITENATKKYFIIQASTGDRLALSQIKNYDLKSQDIIFVEEKNDYNSWERLTDIIQLSSQILTIFAILNNMGK
ncbi:MAG: hypothetical protein CMG59_02355 [Candidatus Marinimicrobia bacterium]|nr:hypothetical protein [Candidatus Neomarinimicrobiota bacterium]